MSTLRRRPVIVGIVAATLLAGCGQQGPLYLRDEQPAAVVTPVDPAAQSPAADTPPAATAPGVPAAARPDETTPRTTRDPARTPR